MNDWIWNRPSSGVSAGRGLALVGVLCLAGCGSSGGDDGDDRVPPFTERVSVATDGSEASGVGYAPTLSDISGDGRYVVFATNANNLVGEPADVFQNIFLRDREAGTTTRLSVAPDGSPANNHSYKPAISDDGRYVVFGSQATNLVAGDGNGRADIFRVTMATGGIERVSVSMAGGDSDGDSSFSAISADGDVVAFESDATNLVASDSNGETDVFAHFFGTGVTELVSLNFEGAQGGDTSARPCLSADGTTVAFTSLADLTVGNNFENHVYVRDIGPGATLVTTRASGGGGSPGNNSSGNCSLSGDGRLVAFESSANNLVVEDTNAASDIFVYDVMADSVERASLDSAGTQVNGASQFPQLTPDGQYLVFDSLADGLTSDSTIGIKNIYRVDRDTGGVELISLTNSDDAPGNGASEIPNISSDGAHISFASQATNLVSGDENDWRDIFVRTLE